MVVSMPKVIDVEERRAELAEAAARLIARAGIGAATMREVAAEAGWTTGALTHYFTNKRELMLFTFRESLARRRTLRDARDESDPRRAIVQSLEGALPLDDDRRRHWMVNIAFCAEAAGDTELSTTQREAYRENRAHVARLLRAGGCATDAAAALAERLLTVANGIAVQALFDPKGWSPRRQLDHLHESIEPLLGPTRTLSLSTCSAPSQRQGSSG